MRIVKFRAWDILHNRMVWFNKLVRTDVGNLMQFTGLLDKNGKEIYEGDIVKCSVGCPHEIVWSGDSGMPGWWLEGTIVGLMGPYHWTGDEEVIGNIHENPELLITSSK